MNEPVYPFLSDTPEDEAKAKAYQLGFNDGLRIGLEKGIFMANEIINIFHSEIAKARIVKIEEIVQKMKEG